MSKALKLTPARAKFLRDVGEKDGMSSTERYHPCKWAMEHGFVTCITGRFGSRTYYLTPAGAELLKP